MQPDPQVDLQIWIERLRIKNTFKKIKRRHTNYTLNWLNENELVNAKQIKKMHKKPSSKLDEEEANTCLMEKLDF